MRATRHAGFTLIEVLVTLVIVAAAAGVVLTHARTLLDLRARYLAEQEAVNATLNRVALLPALDLATLRLRLAGDHVALGERDSGEVILEVRNLAPPGQDPIPVDQAYTPFQVYRLEPASRYPLSLILKGLPPPQG